MIRVPPSQLATVGVYGLQRDPAPAASLHGCENSNAANPSPGGVSRLVHPSQNNDAMLLG